MKIKMIVYFSLIILTLHFNSCQPEREKITANLAPNAHQVTAEEVIQTNSYTYVRVSADERDYWIAIGKSEVVEGKTYYWSDGIAMRDFPSKELNRTFATIFLVQDFSDKPITLSDKLPSPSTTDKHWTPEKNDIVVDPVNGGITIAELFSEKASYNGKKVKVRGEVVKFSGGIMNRNWIHIQDGTKDADHYDLTITSQDFVKVGDVAVFEGTISLDKDFGAGYFYDVIMEDASLVNNEL